MHIFLTILLWILIILLLLLAALLIVPISYRLEGTYGSQVSLYAKVRWLFMCGTWEGDDLIVKIGPYKLPDFEPSKKKDKTEPFDWASSRSLLTNLDIKSIISLGIILVKKLLKKIAPHHFYVRGVVGFDCPCATGQFIGMYESVAHAVGVRDQVNLSGDFCGKNIELDLKISGRFAVASLLGPCLWFIFQKPIRKILLRKKGRVK